MEAPEHRDRVRPLPPEGETGDHRRTPSMRALLPMLAGGAILVAFIGVLSLSGGPGEPENAAAAGASTTTTVPPFVRDEPSTTTTTIAVPTTIVTREAEEFGTLLPELTQGLQAVVQREDGSVAVARWRFDRRFAQFTDLPSGPARATIDASGTLVASIGDGTPVEDEGLLTVGSALVGVRPVFVRAGSYAWHGELPGVMAVVGQLPTDERPGLFIITMDELGAVRTTQRIIDAQPEWFVTAFRGDRIAIVDNSQDVTFLNVFSVDGTSIAREIGFSTFTTPDLIFGAGETALGFTGKVWTWDLTVPEQLPLYASTLQTEVTSPSGEYGARIQRAPQSRITVVGTDDLTESTSTIIDADLESAFFFDEEHIAAFASTKDTLYILRWRDGYVAELILEGIGVRDVGVPMTDPFVDVVFAPSTGPEAPDPEDG